MGQRMCKQMLGLLHQVGNLSGKESQGLVPPPAISTQGVTTCVLFDGERQALLLPTSEWAVVCRQVDTGLQVTAVGVKNGDLASALTTRNDQTKGCAPPSPRSGPVLGTHTR